MQYFRVNDQGKPIDVVENNDEKDSMIVEGWSGSFYDPTYNFENKSWFEGMSQEGIDTIVNNPIPFTPIEQLQKDQADLTFQLLMERVI